MFWVPRMSGNILITKMYYVQHLHLRLVFTIELISLMHLPWTLRPLFIIQPAPKWWLLLPAFLSPSHSYSKLLKHVPVNGFFFCKKEKSPCDLQMNVTLALICCQLVGGSNGRLKMGVERLGKTFSDSSLRNRAAIAEKQKPGVSKAWWLFVPFS